MAGRASAFLAALWRQGALFGASVAEAFFVVCDATNNPPEECMQGRLSLDIGLAATHPAEFIVIRIALKSAVGPDD